MKLKSFAVAINGIISVFKEEKNFKIMIICFLVTILTAAYLKISRHDWIVVLICSGVVLSAEIFNTVIENIIDMISPEYNARYGLIKDMSAGAVLIISVFALIIGIIIFEGYIFK